MLNAPYNTNIVLQTVQSLCGGAIIIFGTIVGILGRTAILSLRVITLIKILEID